MSKLVTIQTNVPICPECGGALRHKQITEIYQCYHCGIKYKIVDHGHNEREFVCEKIVSPSVK